MDDVKQLEMIFKYAKPFGWIEFRFVKSCIIAFAQQKQTSVYFLIWLISNELKKYTLV